MTMDLGARGLAEEYLTDVAYVRHFCDDLSPTNLRLVAALNGFAQPPSDDFDYCELGAGNGDTTVALAAAYPRSRFVGVDFNQEHVDFANGLARRGELENLRFLKRDFEALDSRELPDFDFICANGVLSWVAPAKWKAVVDFAYQKLKPGGLFYVSYNALPGWAPIEPLRRLLVDATRDVKGGSLERARQGIHFAQLLSVGGAAYFAGNPAAKKMLDTMLGGGLPYVVHEYFHAHWRTMYFSDVAREMAESGIHYIGQLPLYLNYRDLTIAPQLLELFKMIDDRIIFEGLKDYVINEYFRRDVYILGQLPRSPETTRAYLDEARFGSLVGESEIRREAKLPHYTLKLSGPIFDALIPALTHRTRTVAELAADPALASFGIDTIRDSVRNLLLCGQIVPMPRESVASKVNGGARHRVVLAYNRAILEQPISAKMPFILASPVAGTGITVTLLEAIVIRALTEADPEGRHDWIDALIDADPLEMRVAGKTITDASEQKRVLREELAKFEGEKLAKLVELGILDSVR
jgi:SAM-dependent methyltransferase